MFVSVLPFTCKAINLKSLPEPPRPKFFPLQGEVFYDCKRMGQNSNWLIYKHLKTPIVYVESAGTSLTTVMSLDATSV